MVELNCSFGVINTALTYFEYFIQRDIVATVKVKHSGVPSDRMYARGKYEKYSEYYQIGLEYVHPTKKRAVREKVYIGKLFDEEGYFDRQSLKKAMDQLVNRFAKNKVD